MLLGIGLMIYDVSLKDLLKQSVQSLPILMYLHRERLLNRGDIPSRGIEAVQF